MSLFNHLRFRIRPISELCVFKINNNFISKVPGKTYLSTCYTFRQLPCLQVTSLRYYSSKDKTDKSEIVSEQLESTATDENAVKKVSKRTQLKQAVRDYGATIIVFHVTISLASLGLCYATISNGIDAVQLLKSVGFSDSVISSKIAVEGSTFVMSYAVHKLFAPVRIGITLSVAPFIVKYLRKKKWLKPPKK